MNEEIQSAYFDRQQVTLLPMELLLVKRHLPQIEEVNYLTDSSQYRNRTIIYLVEHHSRLFELSSTWQFFECGHGKGPYDGFGGNAKRSADDAVKRGYKITCAQEFFTWAQTAESVIQHVFVGTKDKPCS